MRPTPKDFGKGLGVSALSLALYAIALACFNALMLLIISMEEGGQGVTDYTMDFTESVMLLSQGIGLEFESVRLTLVPWGLTILLVVLIRSAAARLGCSWSGFLTGLVFWVAMHAWMAATVQMVIIDAIPIVMLKTGAVYTVGYLWALIPRTNLTRHFTWDAITFLPESMIMAVRAAVRLTVIIAVCFTLMSFITVGTWSVMNHPAMSRLLSSMGMETGSAIMTTIASLIWLPTFMAWALSWVSGAGFSIGSLATFSLWNGQAQSLPTIPVFALFPESVELPWARIVLMAIPFALAMILGLWQLFASSRFNVLGRKQRSSFSPPRNADDADTPQLVSWKTVYTFVPPTIAFCLTCVLISVLLPIVFAMSNGSLGYDRLAHIGVDVAASTQALARPTALGFFAAWLIGLVSVAARYGIAKLSQTIRNRTHADSVNRASTKSTEAVADDERTPRTVASGGKTDTQSATASTVEAKTFRTVSSAESVNPTTKEDK
ncbi:DUF6350 family protein [Bifidobacterium callimiconis]|uniref:Uncharacterized protein n=1 Tax=Bifidobacterium callimiconis TaxID=2306973 RepID=A0A430FHF1_9BIFI|nr:DUF6350 family protein [Bifidobacterium callimiconis]MBT1177948.1 hypothetical protein [Bifidobacterium callimiconis]RSX52314.1 hypothetical protein D2E23_0042 [Bifidobacterium callimiconis]